MLIINISFSMFQVSISDSILISFHQGDYNLFITFFLQKLTILKIKVDVIFFILLHYRLIFSIQ